MRGGAQGGKEADLSKEEVQWSVQMRSGSTAVLSACNTFRGVIKAEGVIGLARAFLFACVAAIVVSLWSVDDGSTSVLMELMYQHLMDGRTTVAQALRLAMLHLLRQPSPHWRRPKYWAGFLVVGATTRLRCTTSVEEWTVEDVCRFVQGLSQEFGDQASVYAAAMKKQAIDGKALLHLSAENPSANNKLKELGLTKMGPRKNFKARIEELQTQNLPRMLSTVPGGGDLRSLAFRCTAPSAHPPQEQPPNVPESVEEWTVEDVRTFVQGLSLESGDQASGYERR